MSLENELNQVHQELQAVLDAVGQVMVGQREVIEGLLIGVLAGGHVLLEGVPGLGKTLMIRTYGQVLGLDVGRIQFTPDLMPADILGTKVLRQGELEFEPGPIFGQLVLADEVNRATPKTQSALLQAMQEGEVTVAGETHSLPRPFFVLATQNPLEMEGTYPLPEAQLDRFFFKWTVPFPSKEEVVEILTRTTRPMPPNAPRAGDAHWVLRLQSLVREVPIADHLQEIVAHLVLATHPGSPQAPKDIEGKVRYGVSPRGGQSLTLGAKARALLHGRAHVTLEDLFALVNPAFRHRMGLSFQALSAGVRVEDIIEIILRQVKERERLKAKAGLGAIRQPSRS